MAENSFTNNTNFELLGSGANMLIKQNVASENYKLQITDINAKLDTVRLASVERQGQRAFELNKQLANISVSQARRGLATGGETQAQAVIEQAQVAATSDLINTMNRERALIFQKEVAEFQKKQQQRGALLEFGLTAATAFATGGASLALTAGAVGAAALSKKG